MISPSEKSAEFEIYKSRGFLKETICIVFYNKNLGELEGVEVYDEYTSGYVFVPASQFSKLQKRIYEAKISEHLENLKSESLEKEYEDEPA